MKVTKRQALAGLVLSCSVWAAGLSGNVYSLYKIIRIPRDVERVYALERKISEIEDKNSKEFGQLEEEYANLAINKKVMKDKEDYDGIIRLGQYSVIATYLSLLSLVFSYRLYNQK